MQHYLRAGRRDPPSGDGLPRNHGGEAGNVVPQRLRGSSVGTFMVPSASPLSPKGEAQRSTHTSSEFKGPSAPKFLKGPSAQYRVCVRVCAVVFSKGLHPFTGCVLCVCAVVLLKGPSAPELAYLCFVGSPVAGPAEIGHTHMCAREPPELPQSWHG